MSRYGLMQLVARFPRWGAWPVGTWVVNLLGSFLLGILLGSLGREGVLSQEVRLIIAVGFLGSFTTFSTMMADFVRLGENTSALAMVLNIVPQVVLGILVFLWGQSLGKG